MWRIRLVARRARWRFEIQRDACRRRDLHAASFDRFETGGAFAQPLQRLVDRLVVDPCRRPVQRDRRVVARLERRHRSNDAVNVSGLALLDLHVADVGRVDRLDAPLAQRFVDRARNEVVGDVVQDLLLEALLDDTGRRLAGPEPGMRALRE